MFGFRPDDDDRRGARSASDAATADGPDIGVCACGHRATQWMHRPHHDARAVCDDCAPDYHTAAGWLAYPPEVRTRPGPATQVVHTETGNGYRTFELHECGDGASPEAWLAVENTSAFDVPNMLVSVEHYR